MLKALSTVIALGFATVATPWLSAQKTKTINVTTTVYDCNGACNGSNQLLMRSDDYNGTGFATYANELDTDGSWFLQPGSLRPLWITPNDPVGAQPLAPPANYYSQNLQAHSLCFDQNRNPVPFPNLMNGSNNCQVGVEFGYNGLVYKLVMGPDLPWGGPATGLASVVCNKLNSNQCVDWTIAPNSAAANPNVANLYYYSTSKRTATWVFVGQYYNTFLIHVTNP